MSPLVFETFVLLHLLLLPFDIVVVVSLLFDANVVDVIVICILLL